MLPHMKRCECSGAAHVTPRESPLPGLYCMFCGGWFSLNLTTAEQLDRFAILNRSPVKHPKQIHFEHEERE